MEGTGVGYGGMYEYNLDSFVDPRHVYLCSDSPQR